jgi:chorismate mutase
VREPVRDERREADVLAWARSRADALGLTPETAEKLVRLLVEEAVATQVRDRGEPGAAD